MDDRTRASLLWGFVGALSFLVLGQAARLLVGLETRLSTLLGIAVVVFAIAAVLTHLLGRRLDRKRQL
jgi:membrane protein implicated in regulation of membrane protease activity